MATESQRVRSGMMAIIAIAFAILVMIAAFWVYQQYDPFILNRPAVRDSKALADIARQRSLTDDEFTSAIGYLGSDMAIARLSAIAILQLEAGRSPERKTKVVAALTAQQQTADPTVRKAIAQALSRLQSEKQEQ